jgi:hypothetical protein
LCLPEHDRDCVFQLPTAMMVMAAAVMVMMMMIRPLPVS